MKKQNREKYGELNNLWETSNMENSSSFKPEGEDLWFSNEKYAQELEQKGNTPPGSYKHQNLGHNSKKEGIGAATNRNM